MDKLAQFHGYDASECKSLTDKLLRCRQVVEDENERFYWYDCLKNSIVKQPSHLLENLMENHGSVPTSIILQVKIFWDKPVHLRDHYDAVVLTDTIGSLPVDRNVSRLYEMAVRDDGHDIMNSRLERQSDDAGGRVALEQFGEILDECDGALLEETVRRLAKQALRVDQTSYLFRCDGFDSLWNVLEEYAKRVGVDEDLNQRLSLISESRVHVAKWRKMELKLVLWAIYSLMDLARLPEPTTIHYETAVTKILNSRNGMKRLVMPSFAVDVTTFRGRNCADTKEKLLDDDKIKSERMKEELLQKYSPIEASHGPSPHDTRQTMIEYKMTIKECERTHCSDLVPVLFTMPSQLEHEDEPVDEKLLEQLKKRHWRTVMLEAASEVFDENVMTSLPKGESGTTVLDFDKKVSFEGPMKPLEALQVLAMSVVGKKVAKLESIPKVRLLLNETKNKIYLEKELIGTHLSETERMEVGNNRVTLEQRQLMQANRRATRCHLSESSHLLMIKTLIFRRLMGLPCKFSHLRVHFPTTKVHMTNLSCSGLDHKRFRRITPKHMSVDWLLDSSHCQELIDELSAALRKNEVLFVKLVTWLGKLGNQPPFETILGSELCKHIIQFASFQTNLQEVVNTFGVIPESDDDIDDSDDTEEEKEEEEEEE